MIWGLPRLRQSHRHTRINDERLIDRLMRFIEQGGLMLGICNGFQLLTKLGMFLAFMGTMPDGISRSWEMIPAVLRTDGCG